MKAMHEMGVVPTHIALVFDPLGKNFRHTLFPDYKGNRPPKVAERRRQEELMYDMFTAMGYPCLRVDDVEADDVIGTLATKLSANNIKTYIFTGDKDIMSLVNHNTFVWAGIKKKLYDEREVRLRFNLPPERVIDFLAMQGDSSDNIAGIKGIGEKTAALMLADRTLDDILANPDALLDSGIRGIKGVVETLKKDTQHIALMRQLVTLKLDVALNINLKELVYVHGDQSTFLNGFLTE
jgi:DNA polymerase-1